MPRRNSNATAAKLATHEAVCAERYAGILSRMGRLEKIIMGSTAGVLVGGSVMIWWFVTHLLDKIK